MDIKIFNCMDTYFDTYSYLAHMPRARNDLQMYLAECGKSKSTIKNHISKADKGELSFITAEKGLYKFDSEKFKDNIAEICKAMGITVCFTEKPQKKRTPEDDIASVTATHSPEYMRLKKKADEATGTIKGLEKELTEKDAEIEALTTELERRDVAKVAEEALQKKIVVGTAKFHPEGVFDEDFFTSSPVELLDVENLVSLYGSEIKKDSEIKELTEETYQEHIAKCIFAGKLLKWLSNLKAGKDKEENLDQDKSEHQALTEEERKRLESINEILRMENVPNQVKLSLYGLWFKGDVEMRKLLDYAGEHCINANYVIRLLENPPKNRSYQTIREMMKQAMKASEAQIKKEAALELIAGEWFVEAEYGGETTRFQMIPVSELERIKKASLQYHGENLMETIDRLMQVKSGVSRDDGEKKTSLHLSSNKEKKPREAPDFIHEKDGDVDCHEAVDDDSVFEHFEGGEEDVE